MEHGNQRPMNSAAGHAKHAQGRRPGNVKAQGQRRRSAALGHAEKRDKPCKGGILRVSTITIAPFQGLSAFPDATQANARASLCLGYYIAGPAALRGIGGFALDVLNAAGFPPPQ